MSPWVLEGPGQISAGPDDSWNIWHRHRLVWNLLATRLFLMTVLRVMRLSACHINMHTCLCIGWNVKRLAAGSYPDIQLLLIVLLSKAVDRAPYGYKVQ